MKAHHTKLHSKLAVAFAIVAMAPFLHAATVATIHSTGDGISVGSQDLYYYIVANPSGTVSLDPYATLPGSAPTFPFQAWGSNGPNSK